MAAPTSRLLLTMDDVVGAQYGTFSLMNEDGAGSIPDDAPPQDPNAYGDWVEYQPHFRLCIRSSFDSHTLAVRFELWEGPPPEPRFEVGAVQTKTWTGPFHASRGRVYATEIVDPGEDHRVFDLGATGVEWRVRVILRKLVDHDPEDDVDLDGWDPLADDDGDDNAGDGPGSLEEVVFQFWTPAAPNL